MNPNPTPTLLVGSLKISTFVRLNPEFVKNRVTFARDHRVSLVDDVNPEISYENDHQLQEKVASRKTNIHLVRFGAVRLFTKVVEEETWIQSIDLNPCLLLHGMEDQPLTEFEFVEALSILKSEVAPLLANPKDGVHIVPGLANGKDRIAYWSKVECETELRDIRLKGLHNISHPAFGAAEGTSETRLELKNGKGRWVVRFEVVKSAKGQRGPLGVENVRVGMCLKGFALSTQFEGIGKIALIHNTKRLVRFGVSDLALVYEGLMSKLEGYYLPIPEEWTDRGQGKRVTHAKTFALLAKLTTIPVEELRIMDAEIRQPSPSTRKHLNRDIPVEFGRLNRVSVSSLFQRPEIPAQSPGEHPQADAAIDPQVIAAYVLGGLSDRLSIIRDHPDSVGNK